MVWNGVWRRAGWGVLSAAVVFAPGPRGFSATSNWNTDGSGAFTIAANWTNGVPGANDTAVFARGGGVAYTMSFPGSLGGGINAYSTNQLRVGSNTVTFTAGINASYTVSNLTTAEATRGIIVGYADGNVAVLNSRVGTACQAATVGDTVSAYGALNVDGSTLFVHGSGLDDELIVGNRGVGVLNIGAGGAVRLTAPLANSVVGKQAFSNGTVTVGGAGAAWNTGAVFVGDGGAGLLEIAHGGTVNQSDTAYLGRQVGANGTATVRGSGSTWNSGPLYVGNSGTGRLNVLDGAQVTATGLGFVRAYVGVNPSGNGAVLVSGAGSTLTLPHEINVGMNGPGTLDVAAGGRVVSGGGVIGLAGPGAVRVDGAGSVWEVNGSLGMTLVGGGSASLAITNGGTVTVNGDLTDGGGTTSLTLDGGTLDLKGKKIGGPGAPIDTVTFRAGTLKNVAEVNEGAGLTKTTAGTLALDGTLAFTGPTVVRAGTLVLRTSHTTGARLEVEDGAVARLATSPATPRNVVLKTPAIDTHASGKLDLMDNKLVVTGGDLAAVAARLKAGFNGGAWNGPGIVSGAATPQTALGFARAGEVGLGGGTFGGVPVSANDVLVMHTLAADCNLDGAVNFTDLVRVAQHYGGAGKSWIDGDCTYDGVVDFFDLVKVAQNYTGAAPAGAIAGAPAGFERDFAAAFAQVPEPAGFALASSLGVGILVCRNPRRSI